MYITRTPPVPDDFLETDDVLLRRAGNGDERAFETLILRHLTWMSGLCRHSARSETDAEDLLQEILLRVWRGAPDFHGRAAVRTWLYRIVVNTAADEARRRSRRPLEADLSTVAHQPALSAPELDRTADLSAMLRWALGMLSPDQRIAVALVDLAGYTTSQASLACEVIEATVRSRLSRGRRRLRVLLSETDGW